MFKFLKREHWCIDGNYYSKAKYSLKEARKISSTNEECFNCIDCINCKRSINLNNCRDCEDSNNCNYCEYCRKCYNCTECINCSRCEDCKSCYACEACINCNDKNFGTRAKDNKNASLEEEYKASVEWGAKKEKEKESWKDPKWSTMGRFY